MTATLAKDGQMPDPNDPDVQVIIPGGRGR